MFKLSGVCVSVFVCSFVHDPQFPVHWFFPDLIGLCTGLIATQISWGAASLFMHAGCVGRG